MTNHKGYGVTVEQMTLSLGLFLQVILERLAVMHGHGSASAKNNNNETTTTSPKSDICNTCSAWIKFYGLLSFLFATFKNKEKDEDQKKMESPMTSEQVDKSIVQTPASEEASSSSNFDKE